MAHNKKLSLGALEGIRVIELATWVAAPGAGALLADLGAEVIKIEPPSGDPYRGLTVRSIKDEGMRVNPGFDMDNRGKRSITLNLANDKALEIAHALIDRADIFLTNYMPNRLRRYRLTYASLKRRNPRLIYAQITGYGSKGPDSNRLGFDYAAFWARSGIMEMLGEPDVPPSSQRPGMGDHTTSLALAASLGTALYAREKTGKGQEIDVSLLNTALWVMGIDLQTVVMAHHQPAKVSRKDVVNPLWNTYRTSDGRWIMLVMVQADRYWARACQAIGRPELETDERFADLAGRRRHRAELIAIMDEAFSRFPCAEWSKRLDDAGLIWGLSQTLAEVVNDPQVVANNYMPELLHPDLGPIRMVGSPMKLSATPAQIQGPPPEVGQHSEEVLLELGYDWEEISDVRRSGALG